MTDALDTENVEQWMQQGGMPVGPWHIRPAGGGYTVYEEKPHHNPLWWALREVLRVHHEGGTCDMPPGISLADIKAHKERGEAMTGEEVLIPRRQAEGFAQILRSLYQRNAQSHMSGIGEWAIETTLRLLPGGAQDLRPMHPWKPKPPGKVLDKVTVHVRLSDLPRTREERSGQWSYVSGHWSQSFAGRPIVWWPGLRDDQVSPDSWISLMLLRHPDDGDRDLVELTVSRKDLESERAPYTLTEESVEKMARAEAAVGLPMVNALAGSLRRTSPGVWLSSNGTVFHPHSPAHIVVAAALRMIRQGRDMVLPEGYDSDILGGIVCLLRDRREISDRQLDELGQIAQTLTDYHGEVLTDEEQGGVDGVLRALRTGDGNPPWCSKEPFLYGPSSCGLLLLEDGSCPLGH